MTRFRVFPMQLRPGDLFVDASGEWEVVGEPAAMRGGKIERVWVQHPDEPATKRAIVVPAYEKIAVRRKRAKP